MTIRIVLRRDPAAKWAVVNPVLRDGEPGYERDTGKFKIGNGVARWSELPYHIPADEDQATLEAHISSSTPHPVYDDGPDLVLLYENAKV